MMKKIFTTITLAASMLFAACTARQDINLTGSSDSGVVFTTTINVDNATKSSMDEEKFNKISNNCAFFYNHATGQLVASAYNTGNTIRVTLPDVKTNYDIYTVCNFGDITADVKAKAATSALMKEYVYVFPNYDTFETWGIPMASCFTNGNKSFPNDEYRYENINITNVKTIQVNKLASRLSISLYPDIRITNLSIAAVRLVNCNGAVRPFKGGFGARNTNDLIPNAKCDILTDDDIDTILSAGTVDIWCLENCQGNAISNIVSAKEKTPEKAAKPTCVTYLEIFTDEFSTTSGEYVEMTYRICPGGLWSSFDYNIMRNHNHNYDINLSDAPEYNGWTIDYVDMFGYEILWATGNNELSVYTGNTCTTTATLYGTNKKIHFHLDSADTDIEYSLNGGDYTRADQDIYMYNNKPVSVSYRARSGNSGFPKLIASIPNSRVESAKNIIVLGNSSLDLSIDIPHASNLQDKVTIGKSSYNEFMEVFGQNTVHLGTDACENGEPNIFIKGQYRLAGEHDRWDFKIEACIEIRKLKDNEAEILNFYGLNGFNTQIHLSTKPWGNMDLENMHVEFNTGNSVWDEYLNNSIVIDKVINGVNTHYTVGTQYRDASFPITDGIAYLTFLFRFN